MQLIRLLESKPTTKKQKLSECFAGCLTTERADELQAELIQMRKEWDLINVIKNLPDYAREKEKEIFDIPESQQKLVLKRLNKVRKNPERSLDWDVAANTLKA